MIRLLRKITIYGVLAVIAFLSAFPYLWSLSTSFKLPEMIFADPQVWIPIPPQWKNYVHVWNSIAVSRYILNTLLIAGLSVLGQLVFGSLAAYAYARMEFKGKQVLFLSYLATLMIPGIVTLIPLFMIMKYLNWIDTYYALIVPQLLGTPIGIFLLRQFFMSVPKEMEEAAFLDGAGTFGIFTRIFIPVSKSILSTLAIITFVANWNNFLWPLIVTNSDRLKVVSVAVTSFAGEYGSQWQYMMAASIIILLPLIIIFLFAQKQILNSIQLTGLK